MKNTTSQTATPINHGRIPYLCSAKTSTGYCTNNADVKLNTGSKAILCNEHYAQTCKHGVDVYNCYDGCYDEMKNGTVS